MSILIRGREMPENCQECVCLNDEYFYCQAVGRQPQDENVISRRPDWCPLVAVPQHGRLIDADALMKEIQETCKRLYGTDDINTASPTLSAFKLYIGEAPTVIEAEEET